jgi:POT family proton-dependent oligopeptide transporter
MPKEEEKKRIFALLLVFLVVIFFWMSFHQNGLTMTFFARDYTVKTVDSLTNVVFNIWSLIAVTGAIFGLVYLVKRSSTSKDRGIGAALLAGGAIIAYLFYKSFNESNDIEPETFQQFNALFVVALTPAVVATFAWLRARDKEPSTPRKIGMGMIMAAFGFTVLLVGSLGLVSPAELANQPSPDRVSPFWLISTYFILTVAELFLSPMGISFVSKVAPPRFQGLMQGGWLGATALGNKLVAVGSTMWMKVNVWQIWLIFVICCLISAAFIFSLMKRLEKATKQ